jgi:hypothetical protein
LPRNEPGIESSRILDGDPVVHGIGADAREALDDTPLFAGAEDRRVSLIDVAEVVVSTTSVSPSTGHASPPTTA